MSRLILKQAVEDWLKSLAAEETALSGILRLENELMQNAKISAPSLEEFVAINESAKGILAMIAEIQNVASANLQSVRQFIDRIEPMEDPINRVPEEPLY